MQYVSKQFPINVGILMHYIFFKGKQILLLNSRPFLYNERCERNMNK